MPRASRSSRPVMRDSRLAKTLVGAVSHDLRAPLTRIKASSSTLADSELAIDPETTRKLAALIDAQADRLADLVQNLLDMSRIQAGVLQPRYSVAPLAEVVNTVVNDLTADRRGHTLQVDIPDDLPPIDADLVLISRVLTNLLENALRYSPKSKPIAVRAHLDTPGRIEVTVTDHGPGVNPARRHEIFELFTRRDADAGAGLGLTIAKTFVDAHGQRIWVDEAPGGGAVFQVRVPGLPRSQRRQGLHPPDDPRERLGTCLRQRASVPQGLRLPVAAQAQR